jgi:hypothetical protein
MSEDEVGVDDVHGDHQFNAVVFCSAVTSIGWLTANRDLTDAVMLVIEDPSARAATPAPRKGASSG